MNQTNFLRGIGFGMALGAALGMAMTPRRQNILKKSTAGKAIRAVADVMDNLTDAMGL
jgi:gas vesicle protein